MPNKAKWSIYALFCIVFASLPLFASGCSAQQRAQAELPKLVDLAEANDIAKASVAAFVSAIRTTPADANNP